MIKAEKKLPLNVRIFIIFGCLVTLSATYIMMKLVIMGIRKFAGDGQ